MENRNKENPFKSYLFSNTFSDSSANKDEQKEDKSLWVPDEQAEFCFNCLKKFYHITNRKHHCRICGNVFCSNCLVNFAFAISNDKLKEIKACAYCNKMFQKYEEILGKELKSCRNEKKEEFFCSKLVYYVNLINERRNKFKKFIGIDEKSNTYTLLNKKIHELFLTFANSAIKKVLSESKKYPGLYEKWGRLISELVIEAIKNVSPSFQVLDDDIDINSFIKIKTICYQNSSLSRVIDGFAMQKNVCTKKMKINIQNPSILLLDCALEGKRDLGFQMTNVLNQEIAYIEILKKKIELAKPNVVLITQNASHKFQEDFSNLPSPISLVTNVKEEKIKKIARCTKTFVLPSADFVGVNTFLGNCELFKVEKIKEFNRGAEEQKDGIFFKENEYNLMIFQGCGKMLFSTIILSGPDKEELKEIKHLLRTSILLTVRDLYLQTFILKTFNADVFQANDLSETNEASNDMKFSYGFDVQIMKDSTNNFELTQLSMLNGKGLGQGEFRQTLMDGIPSRGLSIVDKNPLERTTSTASELLDFTSTPGEMEIRKSVSKICEKPIEVSMRYYSRDRTEEKPLGLLIIDLCKQKGEKCQKCSSPLRNHSYYLYRDYGRIRISMVNKGEDGTAEAIKYIKASDPKWEDGNIDNSDIYTYGFCELCNGKPIVTPLFPLPNEILNFSASKFYKHILYNQNLKNRIINESFNTKDISSECEHYLYKDVSRVFLTKLGNIKFSYDSIIKYVFVDTSSKSEKAKELKNIQIKKILENNLIEARWVGNDVLLALKKGFEEHLATLENMKPQILTEQISHVVHSLNIALTSIKELLDVIQEFTPEKFENTLKANVSVKILFLKILQVKVTYNMITKIIRKINNLIFIDFIKTTYTVKPEPEPKDHPETPTQKDETPVTVEKTTPQGESTIDNNERIIQEKLKEKNKKDEENIENYYNIDKNPSYKKLLDYIMFYDDNHTKYAVNVNENDLCSLISYLLTSDEYLQYINSEAKFQLNEIKRVSQPAQKGTDNELFQTSLLFNMDNVRYTCEKVEDEKVKQRLETDLLSEGKKDFHLHISFDLEKLINEAFTDIKSKLDNSNSIKINYTDMVIQYKETRDDLEKIRKEIKKIKETSYGDIKSKFKFMKVKHIEEKQTPIKGVVVAYYPKQFEAMRILYASSYEDFILSIAKSQEWTNVSGGKSKANFYKSHDDKYIIKCVTKLEFKMFIDSGPHYFHHTNKFLFHKMPSAMTKTLGAFKVKIDSPVKVKHYCVIMENLYYNVVDENTAYEAFDLKGSVINRYIPKKDQELGKVLQDTNFLERFQGEPLVLEKNLYTLFKSSIKNDCLILSKMTVIDYSLFLIILTETEKEKVGSNVNRKGYIKIGIIDYYRKFTWDKNFESLGKKMIHRFNDPTIVNPESYKNRFEEKMVNYFIGI